VVASPAAYLAPAAISDAELLAESLVLALLQDLATQTIIQYELSTHWLPLVNGIRLWLLWEQDLPLSNWREPVVRWVLGDGQAADIEEINGAPAFAGELCAQHYLWMASPLEVRIPISCWRQTRQQGEVVAWRYWEPRYAPPPLPLLADAPLTQLDSVGQPLRYEHPASAVTLATVAAYAANTNGADRLPALLATFKEHESWETLMPAVFGVSLAGFEAGWRAYMSEQYGLRPEELPRLAY
jgi:hypothetical protein